MSPMTFTATVEKSETKTFIVLPFDPNEAWGVKERHYITGSVDGHPVRGPLGQDGAQYILLFGDAWQRGAGLDLAVGTTVAVELMPEGPQLEGMGADLVAALEAEPQAKRFFEALATFYRKKYLRWIDGARKPAARAARIAEWIELLKAGKKQRE